MKRFKEETNQLKIFIKITEELRKLQRNKHQRPAMLMMARQPIIRLDLLKSSEAPIIQSDINIKKCRDI